VKHEDRQCEERYLVHIDRQERLTLRVVAALSSPEGWAAEKPALDLAIDPT
jgi:hypothetical protein